MNVNYCVPILHISCKNIIDVDTENMIPQFNVVYISMTSSKQNKTFREQVYFFTAIFDTKTSQAIKTI